MPASLHCQAVIFIQPAAQQPYEANSEYSRGPKANRFVLTELLCQIDGLDETIARFDEQVRQACGPFEEAVELLDTIPGLSRQSAETIISEIGSDMSHFRDAEHLAAWAGVAGISSCIRYPTMKPLPISLTGETAEPQHSAS